MAYPEMEEVENTDAWLEHLVQISLNNPKAKEKAIFKLQGYDWKNNVWINNDEQNRRKDIIEKLVYSVVKKFQGYDIEDLKQVGMVGLAKAYKNYKEGFNTKFSTYAYTYILGEVLSYIRESRSFKISKEYGSLYKKINEAKDNCSDTYDVYG